MWTLLSSLSSFEVSAGLYNFVADCLLHGIFSITHDSLLMVATTDTIQC